MAAPGLPPLIDTHAHLADPGLTRDLEGVLDRARTAGVVQIVAIATDAADSAVVLDRARTHRGVFAAVGVHPNDAAKAKTEDWARVTDLSGVDRSSCEYAWLPLEHAATARALRDAEVKPAGLWARRWRVTLRSAPLLMQELFLPAIGRA